MSKSVIELCAKSVRKAYAESTEAHKALTWAERSEQYAKAVLTTLAANLDEEAFRRAIGRFWEANKEAEDYSDESLYTANIAYAVQEVIKTYLTELIKEEKQNG